MKTGSRSTTGITRACIACVLLLANPGTGQTEREVHKGVLRDGTEYLFQVPRHWNGTLLVSLDTLSTGAVLDWLTGKGYALAGTTRSNIGWNLTKAAENLAEATALFGKTVRLPDRTIVWGMSRGGIVTRASLQLYPELYDGALPMCGGGAGTIGMWNAKLDAAFALDMLVGSEHNLRLQLSGIQDLPGETSRIQKIIEHAQQTSVGRARVALAGALAQVPVWNAANQSRPAEDDYDRQQANVAASLGMALGTVFIPNMEELAGGPFTWNHGVDYKAQLNKSGYAGLVRALYENAGISLEKDIGTLNEAPRLSASSRSVGFIEKHNMTWTGNIRQPVLSMNTTGDPAGPVSDDAAYADVVSYAGKSDLLRNLFVDRGGHCNFTPAEMISAFVMLLERLETGQWPGNASTKAINDLAKRIQAEASTDLGEARFVDITPLPPMRPWDVRNWNTYKPE